MLYLPKWKINLACLIGGHVIDDEVAQMTGWAACHNCREDLWGMEYEKREYPTLDLWPRWFWLRYQLNPHRLLVRLTRRWRCEWCDGWKSKNHDCLPF